MSKERPILFNAAMVRAILNGHKTQTRRIVPKWQMPAETEGPHDKFPDSRWMSVAQRHPQWGFGVFGATEDDCMNNYNIEHGSLCPYGQPGDRLWVRETFQGPLVDQEEMEKDPTYFKDMGRYKNPEHCAYRASGDSCEYVDQDGDLIQRWKPSIHMPRWASRITLEIVSVRVERLQDIKPEDCIAEGCTGGHGSIPGYGYSATEKEHFRNLWESINGSGSWEANPWVWVIEFKRLEASQ